MVFAGRQETRQAGVGKAWQLGAGTMPWHARGVASARGNDILPSLSLSHLWVGRGIRKSIKFNSMTGRGSWHGHFACLAGGA